MSASATRESGGHAGARRLAKGVASGGERIDDVADEAAIERKDGDDLHHAAPKGGTVPPQWASEQEQ
ncbi:MAG: hypothetical protein CMN25_07420 [Salinicola sp.]|nr:hypothetical protein [Salinicola sp.]